MRPLRAQVFVRALIFTMAIALCASVVFPTPAYASFKECVVRHLREKLGRTPLHRAHPILTDAELAARKTMVSRITGIPEEKLFPPDSSNVLFTFVEHSADSAS